MKFKALQLHSAPEVLVEEILQLVRSGELQPGMRMPSQRELARMFQVGLGTVREAVQILHATGYLKVIRGKGTFIAQDALNQEKNGSRLNTVLEAVSLADLMKARVMVECGAAREAAKRAEEEDIDRLLEALDKLREDCRGNETFYQVDFALHVALAEATNNQVIYEIDKLLVDKSHYYIGFMGNSLKTFEEENLKRSIETWERIIDALVRGNGDDASAAMHEHLNIVNYELEVAFLPETFFQKGK